MNSVTFVSTKLPFPSDKDGNSENIFNIIKTLKDNYNFKVSFYLFSNIKDLKFNEFSLFVDEFYVLKPISKYFFWIIPFIHKRINTSTTIFFSDFNAGYYYSLFPKKNKKLFYVADSPTFFYSKDRSLKSLMFYFKYFFEEIYLFPKFKRVMFVAKLDLEFSISRLNNNGIVIPIGYSNTFKNKNIIKEYDLVFSGNFNYFPNYKAAEIFLDSFFLSLLDLFPNIIICFAGRFPSEKMKRFALKYPRNIYLTGEVSNLIKVISKSRIFFSPLLTGSGMKNKIVQAMSCGLPIVCTEESISGFNEFNQDSIKVAKNLSEFFQFLVEFLNFTNSNLELLGNINYQFFLKYYSWNSVVAEHYLPLFQNND